MLPPCTGVPGARSAAVTFAMLRGLLATRRVQCTVTHKKYTKAAGSVKGKRMCKIVSQRHALQLRRGMSGGGTQQGERGGLEARDSSQLHIRPPPPPPPPPPAPYSVFPPLGVTRSCRHTSLEHTMREPSYRARMGCWQCWATAVWTYS